MPEFQRQLERIAAASRDALFLHRAQLGIYLSDFPRGACGPVSEVLGRVISEEFGVMPMYVCGSKHPQLPEAQSHAWLEIDEIVIDITHDQFENTGMEGWVFRRSDWHAKFREIDQPRAPILSEDQWPAYPMACYQIVRMAAKGIR